MDQWLPNLSYSSGPHRHRSIRVLFPEFSSGGSGSAFSSWKDGSKSCDPDGLAHRPISGCAPKSIGEGASSLFGGRPESLEDVSCSGTTPRLHRCKSGVALEQETCSGLAGLPAKRLLAWKSKFLYRYRPEGVFRIFFGLILDPLPRYICFFAAKKGIFICVPAIFFPHGMAFLEKRGDWCRYTFLFSLHQHPSLLSI